MTKQEIFEKAVLGVIHQGGPSAFANGTCAYRGQKGRKCAVGHVLDDKFYNKTLEGAACTATHVMKALEHQGFTMSNIWLLRELQLAHDNLSGRDAFVERFISEASRIAEQHGLTMPAIDTP